MVVQESSGVPWPRVSVVIPALNEARNLRYVIGRIPPDVHEVILVDGDSVDGTVRVARELRPDVRVIVQTRRSKWDALARGFAEATGDIVAILDGDGSADPGEITRFVTALIGGAEFAKGTRFAVSSGRSDVTRLRRLGNRVLSGLVNVLFGTQYSDLCYGLSVVWRRYVPVLGLDDAAVFAPSGGDGRVGGAGREVGARILMRAAAAGLVVAELPSSERHSFERPRTHGMGNLDSFGAGMSMLWTILIEHRRATHRSRESAGAVRVERAPVTRTSNG